MTDADRPGAAEGPQFDEPWQGRAVALAVESIGNLGVSWDDFRDRLMAAIAADPERPYYESWVSALEQLVVDVGRGAALDQHRLEAATYWTSDTDGAQLEVVPIADGPEHERRIVGAARDEGGVERPGLAGSDDGPCRQVELQRRLVDSEPVAWRVQTYGNGDRIIGIVDLPDQASWDRLRRRVLGLSGA